MARRVFGLLVLMTTAMLAGCVERKYHITSDPPGAVVIRNGQNLGTTPVDDSFVYYGKYHFQIVKDGYEILQVDQDIPAPWYQWPGIDFFAETLWPFSVKDEHRFHYQLQPVRIPNADEVLNEAQMLRERGAGLGPVPSQKP